MNKKQNAILIVWCLAMALSLLYVPWGLPVDSDVVGISGLEYKYSGWLWDRQPASRMNDTREVDTTVVFLRCLAITIVCGSAFLVTLKRKQT